MTQKLDFSKGAALIPAIIQDDESGDVLMLGYMNEEALQKTGQTGWVYFWSRKRNKLWKKGEQSGNKFKVKKIYQDCDNDTILIKVTLIGQNACHLGKRTCFSELVNL